MPNLTLLVCHTYSSPKQKQNNSLSPSSPFWPIWTMTLGGFNPNAIAATQTGHLTPFAKVSPWPAHPRICHVLITVRKWFFFLLIGPCGLPRVASGHMGPFILEAALENVLPQPLESPKTVWKHVSFSHDVQRFQRLHEITVTLCDF